jgi:hypothetical protein
MDHVASHLQWIRTDPRILEKCDWYDDPELQDWLLEKGMIGDDARAGWRICDAPPPRPKENQGISQVQEHAASDSMLAANRELSDATSIPQDITLLVPAQHPTKEGSSLSTDADPNTSNALKSKSTESTDPFPTQKYLAVQALLQDGEMLPRGDAAAVSRHGTRLDHCQRPDDDLEGTEDERLSSSSIGAGFDSESPITLYDYDIEDLVSEATECTDDSSSDSTRSLLRSTNLTLTLREFGLQVLRHISSELLGLLNDSVIFTACAGSSGSSGNAQSSNTQISSNDSQPFNSGRSPSRGAEGSGKPNGNDSNDDRGSGRKLPISQADIYKQVWRLACPFFKRNPENHRKWRSCAGPGWPTVHRVK